MAANRLRLLRREALNQGGVNVGDHYLVLQDEPTLAEQLLGREYGIKVTTCEQLQMCDQYRLELVTEFGTQLYNVRLTGHRPPYATFAAVD